MAGGKAAAREATRWPVSIRMSTNTYSTCPGRGSPDHRPNPPSAPTPSIRRAPAWPDASAGPGRAVGRGGWGRAGAGRALVGSFCFSPRAPEPLRYPPPNERRAGPEPQSRTGRGPGRTAAGAGSAGGQDRLGRGRRPAGRPAGAPVWCTSRWVQGTSGRSGPAAPRPGHPAPHAGPHNGLVNVGGATRASGRRSAALRSRVRLLCFRVFSHGGQSPDLLAAMAECGSGDSIEHGQCI